MQKKNFYFNPRPPCGGRPSAVNTAATTDKFQSTSPVWRTTLPTPWKPLSIDISIDVPRVEDDFIPPRSAGISKNFNPRPPCGGRLKNADGSTGRHSFQSTSPVWRTTRGLPHLIVNSIIFQSTSPVWRTTAESEIISHSGRNKISIRRPPCGGRPNHNYFVNGSG